MADPRERIETDNLLCYAGGASKWWLTRKGACAGAANVLWPEVVAFARGIIEADEAWREQNTPTLEELRARYPGAMVEITPLHIPGDDYLARLVTESVSVEHAAPTVGHALEWLAARLAETEDETDGQ